MDSRRLKQRKLTLVLDLDETLLHTQHLQNLPPHEVLLLSQIYAETSSRSAGFHQIEPEMFTKLRPFVREFLQEASTMFLLHVNTWGTYDYALSIIELLDPSCSLFGGGGAAYRLTARLWSKTHRDPLLKTLAHRDPLLKTLAATMSSKSTTLILDDRLDVWSEECHENLILIDKYQFFGTNGVKSPSSLLTHLKDESAEAGMLAKMLELLREVHRAYFDNLDDSEKVDEGDQEEEKGVSAGKDKDVRKILHTLRSQILVGCKIRMECADALEVAPQELGAVCADVLDDSITHVVTLDKESKAAKWAMDHSCHLVHPRWIEAAAVTWKRPPEKNYFVDAPASALYTFSQTVDLQMPLFKSLSLQDSGPKLICC